MRTVEIGEGLRFEDGNAATLNIAEDGSVELGADAWSVFELDSLANPNDQVVSWVETGIEGSSTSGYPSSANMLPALLAA